MNQKEVIEIIFAGDYHVYGRFNDFTVRNPDHDIFDKELVDLISGADLSVFNLEDPLTNRGKAIVKYGPTGVGSREGLIPVKRAGFRLATMATNHTLDMGVEGLNDTISACSESGIQTTGAGRNEVEARSYFLTDIKGLSIAIINFSRIEFNIADDHTGGANSLDVINNVRDIFAARERADLVFVVIHEGLDVFHLPYPYLQKQMRFYIDVGADAIILHHSRIISGYEIYNNKPIFYGIGNLLHLTDNPCEREGLLIKFSITGKENISFDIMPICFSKEKILASLCSESDTEIILKKVEERSRIISDESILRKEWVKYLNTKDVMYLSMLAGHPRIFYRAAKKLNILALYKKILLLRKKRFLAHLNILNCQAHNESVKSILKELI